MSFGDFVVNILPRPIAKRINAIPLGRRLARGAFWTLAGSVAARVLRMPVSIALARLMGRAEYGQLGITSGSIDLFTTLAGLGLGLTATKYIAELRQKDPERVGRIIGVSSVVATVAGAVFSIVLFAVAPWLAAHTLAAPRLTVPLRVGTLALFFSSVNGAQAGALYGFEAFHVMASLQAIVGVLDVPFMLGGYFLGGLNGVLFGMAASRCANWILLRRAIRMQLRRYDIRYNFRDWRHEVGVLWRFSIPAALSGIMVIPVNWICSAVLVNQPNGYSEMGAYSAANQWYNMLMFLPAVLGGGLLPILSDRMGDNDTRSSGKILSTMMKLNGALLIPVAAGMSIFAPPIMRLYGVAYRDAWPTLITVLWTAVIIGVISPVGDVIAASGKMWLGLVMNLGWATVYVSTTLLLVHWGSLGLASSRLIAYIVHTGWTLAFAYVVIHGHDKRGDFVPELQEPGPTA